MTDEEKKAIDYFKEKIRNKLPLYEETYIDGKPYRRNILQLETNFTEEQSNKTGVLLNLIEKQSKEIEELKEDSCCMTNCVRRDKEKLFLEDKIKARIEEWDKDIKWNNADDHYYAIKMMQSLLEKE